MNRTTVAVLAWLACATQVAAQAPDAHPKFQGDRASSASDESTRSTGDDPGAELLFGDARAPLGYAVYRTSFVEFGGTAGWMPWLSADGRARVFVSGLEYSETRGPVINLVTLALALAGVSDTQYVGSSGGYDYYRYDPVGAARQRQAIGATFARHPMSMGIRGYTSALGSDADGFVLDASFQDPIGDALPFLVWGLGLHVGWFRSASQWTGAAFESVWGGANLDLRVTLFEYLGLWLRVGAWAGGPNGYAIPIELGPEVLVGNRCVLRALASIDPARPDALVDGLGARFELGVRL